MGKLIVAVVFNAMLIILISANSYAEKIKEIKGTVISVDAGKGTFVFLPLDSSKRLTLKFEKKLTGSVRERQKVKITFEKGMLKTIEKDRGPVAIPIGCGAN